MTTASTTDRAVGAILGTAIGDALGAGYEFHAALGDGEAVVMGGGPNDMGWEPGEWTDDTSMSVPILRIAARGLRLDEPSTLGQVAAAWREWARGARDVGVQTRDVLTRLEAPTEEAARAAARAVHEATGRSAGNGSLMRTAPLALPYLEDPANLAGTVRRVSELTHFEQDAGDACVIWTLAIRHAIVTGELNIRDGIDMLDPERRERWHALLDEAELAQPEDFPRNGWVVQALQGAWSAIIHGDGFVDTVERAVRGGNDTDTVAAIAGALAGAVHGASAIPARWRRILHGWPGMTARNLTELAVLASNGGRPDAVGWPSAARIDPSPIDTLVPHPHDDGVWLASLAALDRLPASVDVVVSLCRVGTAQTSDAMAAAGQRGRDRETVEFWLIDQDGANPNLDFVLRDAADTIAALRAEGKSVAVHCVDAISRTPAVGALYSILYRGVAVEQALIEVALVLPHGSPRPEFADAVRRIAG